MGKTIEKRLQEIGIMVLLFVVILFIASVVGKCARIKSNGPSIEDLHQQQEMIDYHKSQGRTINIVRYETD